MNRYFYITHKFYEQQEQYAWGGLSGKGILHKNIFEKISSLENLFFAWKEFSRGKRNKSDVREFEFELENNIFQLHRELKNKTYGHFPYSAFSICDPKLRKIHKATVRDRILHHAVFRILYHIFDKNFIFDSYSCRVGKGTHRAVDRLKTFAQKASKNNQRNIFALKCDIEKFFDSVDQDILLEIIRRKIKDDGTFWLLKKIILSFQKEKGKGLPLGNVTSQLFANIYMNEFDQFMKHKMRIKHYLRYSDDFIILSDDIDYLKNLVFVMQKFLEENLHLRLHGNKIIFRTHRQGIDFLGYVVFPHHKTLRTKTKKRIMRKIKEKYDKLKNGKVTEEHFRGSLQSYLGILKHCRGHKIQRKIEEIVERQQDSPEALDTFQA